MTKIKRKRPDEKDKSVVSIDKISAPSNQTPSDDQSSGLSFELKKNILADNNQLKATDIKKNSNNLYSIDKCLIPFNCNNSIDQNITPTSIIEKKLNRPNQALTQQKRVFDFTEYSSSSDIDSLIISSRNIDRNLNYRPSNLYNGIVPENTVSDIRQNQSQNISLSTNDKISPIYLNYQDHPLTHQDGITRKMINSQSSGISFQTQHYLEKML